MKIAFFGAFGAFEYFRIGGAESFARRLAAGLLELGLRADFVVYGAPVSKRQATPAGIDLFYFAELPGALRHLAEGYEHVLTMYLYPRDRLTYMFFRRRYRNRLICHQFYFGWPDAVLRRKAAFFDARLYPFNGRLFCVSPRILRYVENWSDRGRLFLPPVPESYFLAPEDKSDGSKTRVTYIGRTDPGKGIEDVIQLFTELKDSPGVEVAIHGFHRRNAAVSEQIHESLRRQDTIPYHHEDYDGYTPEMEAGVGRILKETDVLVLPYRKLSSTIDTPLLLLEGMAALCAVVTRSLGDIISTYGPSPWLISESAQIVSVVDRILEAQTILPGERRRIYLRNRELGFDLKSAANLLVHSLS
jgi:glycosyltransferase involved in cell wall biosynthesis